MRDYGEGGGSRREPARTQRGSRGRSGAEILRRPFTLAGSPGSLLCLHSLPRGSRPMSGFKFHVLEMPRRVSLACRLLLNPRLLDPSAYLILLLGYAPGLSQEACSDGAGASCSAHSSTCRLPPSLGSGREVRHLSQLLFLSPTLPTPVSTVLGNLVASDFQIQSYPTSHLLGCYRSGVKPPPCPNRFAVVTLSLVSLLPPPNPHSA